jgi:hypothetical protein
MGRIAYPETQGDAPHRRHDRLRLTILVDTGVLLAAADEDDTDHEVCAAFMRNSHQQLIAPAGVVYETSWQIENVPRGGATGAP